MLIWRDAVRASPRDHTICDLFSFKEPTIKNTIGSLKTESEFWIAENSLSVVRFQLVGELN